MNANKLQKQTYKFLAEKIRTAISKSEFTSLEKSVTNHYNNGTINKEQFLTLDGLIMVYSANL